MNNSAKVCPVPRQDEAIESCCGRGFVVGMMVSITLWAGVIRLVI